MEDCNKSQKATGSGTIQNNTSAENEQMIITCLQQIKDRLDNTCENPIYISECTPINLDIVTGLLNNILSQIQNIDLDTTALEQQLQLVIDSLQDQGTQIGDVLTSIGDLIISLDAFADQNELDLGQIISSLNSVISLITGSNDALQQIVAKLMEDCAGNPIWVQICQNIPLQVNVTNTDPIPVTVSNQIDLSAIESLLGDILLEIQAIELDTTDLESLLQSIIDALEDQSTENLQILAAIIDLQNQIGDFATQNNLDLAAILSQLQAIQTTLSGSDTTLTAILDKLNRACDDNPINANICNDTPLQVEIVDPEDFETVTYPICVSDQQWWLQQELTNGAQTSIKAIDPDGNDQMVPADFQLGFCQSSTEDYEVVSTDVCINNSQEGIRKQFYQNNALVATLFEDQNGDTIVPTAYTIGSCDTFSLDDLIENCEGEQTGDCTISAAANLDTNDLNDKFWFESASSICLAVGGPLGSGATPGHILYNLTQGNTVQGYTATGDEQVAILVDGSFLDPATNSQTSYGGAGSNLWLVLNLQDITVDAAGNKLLIENLGTNPTYLCSKDTDGEFYQGFDTGVGTIAAGNIVNNLQTQITNAPATQPASMGGDNSQGIAPVFIFQKEQASTESKPSIRTIICPNQIKEITDAIQASASVNIALASGCVDGSEETHILGINLQDGSLAWGPRPLSDYGLKDCECSSTSNLTENVKTEEVNTESAEIKKQG